MYTQDEWLSMVDLHSWQPWWTCLTRPRVQKVLPEFIYQKSQTHTKWLEEICNAALWLWDLLSSRIFQLPSDCCSLVTRCVLTLCREGEMVPVIAHRSHPSRVTLHPAQGFLQVMSKVKAVTVLSWRVDNTLNRGGGQNGKLKCTPLNKALWDP